MAKFYTALKDGDIESLVECITENGEHVNNFTTEDGKTALHVAIEKGNLEIVEILLWNGADPSHKNASGLDCLRYGQLLNQTECINLIISHEIRNKSLYQSCFDIIMKGCPNWFSEFINFKRNNGEEELNIFKAVEQAYDEIITKNLNLNNEIKSNLVTYLIDNNYKKPKWTDNSQECYVKTKLDLLKICDNLNPLLNTELLILKFKIFLKHLSILKLLHFRLKYCSDNLCWTQIEFLISLYICIREQREQINFIYMNLDAKVIISYIQLFLDDLNNSETTKNSKNEMNLLQKNPKSKSKKLNKKDLTEISKIPKEQNVFKKLIPSRERILANKLKQAKSKLEPRSKLANKIRRELKKTYNHFKNLETIERMIKKIKPALDIDLSEANVIGIYAIRRALQIIGEGVKSTDSSLNISKPIVNYIKRFAPIYLIDITTNLRDVLSHGAIFRYSESHNFNNLNNYEQLQKELEKIINFLVDLLYKERCYALKVFFHKILKCKDSNQMSKLKKFFIFKENKLTEKYYSQLDQLKEKWKRISSEFIDLNEQELTYVKDINDYFDKVNSKLGQEVFDICLSTFKEVTKYLRDNEIQIKYNCRLNLKFLNHPNEFSNLTETKRHISFNVAKLIESFEIRETNQKLQSELNDIRIHIQLENYRPLKAINELNFNLDYIPSFEIEQKIVNLFGFLLEGIENRTNIEEEIERHKNIYFVKKKMIEFIKKNPISKENCYELENMAKSVGIDFKNIKVNYLKGDKFKVSKNIENMTSIYGKLVKDMKLYLEGSLKFKLRKNAIEKFFDSNEFKINSNDNKKWLKNIFENHQNHADQKIQEYLLKLKKNLFELIPANIPNDEKSIAEEYAKYKENGKLQSAVEMILFEIFQIIFEDDDKSEQDHSSMFTGRDLRNYLAHGNIFFDVFAIDPSRIIFMNAIILATMADDSYVTINDFKRIIESNIKIIYEMRSSWIENIGEAAKDDSYELEDSPYLSEYRLFFADFISQHSAPSENSEIVKQKRELQDTDIFPAITLNNLKIVQILCKKGINVNQIDDELKFTPLTLVCRLGFLEIVIELLKYGADISICDFQENNALMVAIHYGFTKISECLLEHLLKKEENFVNKVLNCVNNKRFHILHLAIENIPIRVIKKLILTGQIDISMETRGESFLHVGCYHEKSSVVKFLLSQKANIIEDQDGKSPLFFAVILNNIKIAKMLLKVKQNLDGLLFQAIGKNNIEMVKLLIKNNADINETQNGRNILQYTISFHHSQIAIYLIENKFFDLNSCIMEDGQTLFHLAASGMSTKVIEALMKYPEFANKINAIDCLGNMPLLYAVLFSNAAMIKCLVLHGADISLFPYLHYALHNQLNVNIIPLLECGANVSFADRDGITPLHFASDPGNIYIAKILIDFGANTEVYTITQFTPLSIAILFDHYDLVLMLLQAGTKITIQNLFGWLYCHAKVKRVECENIAIIKLLIETGSVAQTCWDIELTTTNVDDASDNLKMLQNDISYEVDLFSPLHMAIRSNDLETVKLLASEEQFINCRYCVDNLTPVLLSVILNRLDHLKVLIDAGADVNSICYQNMTPLIFATELRNYEIVEILLKAGADVNATTINGRTALFYASQSVQIEIVKLLIQYGGKIDKIQCMSILNFNLVKYIYNLIMENQNNPAIKTFDIIINYTQKKNTYKF